MKYQIIGKRLKIWDIGFDHYSDDVVSFFNKLESLAGSPPSLALTATPELIEWQNKLWEEFREAVENCRHKIQAINYSISLIESEIKNPLIPNYKSLPIDLDEKEFLDDVILFEFESFLFQISSALDVFVHLLKLFYPCLNSDDESKVGFNGKGAIIKENGINKKIGIAGQKTADTLRRSGENDFADYIEKQVKDWIQVVYDLRNRAAHRSRVQNLQMFLIDKNGLHVPTFSDNGVDLLKYCKETYNNLKIFINYIEEKFLLKKAENFYEMK